MIDAMADKVRGNPVESPPSGKRDLQNMLDLFPTTVREKIRELGLEDAGTLEMAVDEDDPEDILSF